MEESGIGRPSTYVPTIQNLLKSKYVVDESGIIKITEHGSKTAHVLVKYFPKLINVKYTANLEVQLEEIQSGKETRDNLLSSFYNYFMEILKKAEEMMYKDKPPVAEGKCPKCGSDLIYRDSKHGQFIGCSAFPKCDYIKKEEKEVVYTGETCPDCGKPLVERKDKRNRTFVGCSGYPTCKYIKPVNNETKTEKEEEVVKTCPKCGGNLVKKKGKYGTFLGCSNYPNCNHMEKIKKVRRK